MNEIKIFNNEEFGQVRTVMIDNIPYFVGKDVALALGYSKPTDAVRKHVEDEDRGFSEMETPSGVQEMVVINESGLYSLIFGSKLEMAKKFKRWVTSDVLPSIRKTGTYSSVEPLYGHPGEVAKLINTLSQLMKNERHESCNIAKNAELICRQYGIRLVDDFVKVPDCKQISFDFSREVL